MGHLQGKTAIIIDDIVDTGGSLCCSVQMLLGMGAKEVYCACTHGVLSHNAVERISNSGIKEFVITNTIPLPDDQPKTKNIIVLSVGAMLAKVIEAISDYTPVSDVYDLFNGE